MRKKKLFALLLALALLSLCSCSAQSIPTVEKATATGFYFDTVVTLIIYGGPEGMADELLQECDRYEKLLSKTVEGSDVSRINAANGQTVTVDAETWQILKRAKEISDLTGHAFSVTIAPLTAMWDFTGGTERMPTEAERLAALPLVDDDRLVLGDGNTVTLPSGMEIDLGGIAKGYIADKLAEKIRGKVKGALLNFGGNVYAVGEKPDGSAFRVGIRDPKNTDTQRAIVSVKDRTVVTSGTYERFFVKDGVTYHHILDPQTGASAQTDLTSATIVGTSSMDADAFATACIVLGKEKALQLLEDNGLDGLLIDQDEQLTATTAFAEHYPLQAVE